MLASWEEASCVPHNIIYCIIQHIKPSLCARLVPDLFIWASHSLTKLCDPHQRDGGAGLTKLLWMMISSDFVSVKLKWYQLTQSVVALFHNEMTISLNDCKLSSRGDETCLTCFRCRNSPNSNGMNLERLGLNMEHCSLHLAVCCSPLLAWTLSLSAFFFQLHFHPWLRAVSPNWMTRDLKNQTMVKKKKKKKCNGWNGHGEYSNVLQSPQGGLGQTNTAQHTMSSWVKLCQVDNLT